MSSSSSGRPSVNPSPEPRETLHEDVKNTEHLAVLEALNLPVSLITPQYTYRWVNRCYSAAQGKNPDEIIGKTVRALWTEAFDKAIKGNLDRCFDGVEVRDEAWISYPALGPRYCETVYSPYCPNGESAISAMVITYDVTDRKEMEKRLSESEQRFRDLSDASLEAIIFMENGVIVDANKALSRMFGYEDDEPRGRLATDFIAPDHRALTEKRIRTRTDGVYETVGIRKDGSLFPIEVHPKELPHRGRHLRVSAVRDLTERKRIEAELKAYREHLEKLVEERTKELRKSEEKFRSIFENAVEGIFQTTPDGHFLAANPALAAMSGFDTPDDLIRGITDLQKFYVDPARRDELIERLTREGIARNYEYEIRRPPDGVTRWWSLNARTVRNKKGEPLYYEGTVEDITARKQAEEAVRKAEAKYHNISMLLREFSRSPRTAAA